MASFFSQSAFCIFSLVFAGCANNAPSPTDAIALDPITFFLGRTHGDAQMHKIFSKVVPVKVEGVGRRQNDTLILDQTTREGEHNPETRRWVMHKVGPNRYSGSLTDATGPVSITVNGPRAHIEYEMKGGLAVRQLLTLQSDGKTILNKLDVTEFGVHVASLEETIHKLD